ncbi:carbohydrate esterase family 4 [Lecanosticta acicola]|uniref:Carbohydrate esterase family 4 n=1 Tax=Lecanosticta acicola TaxID=111012 RepID=A0AAI8Z6I3_9PEZI|nr:carbohydrate esterase family 4 [Lecanosticta acicola]
MPTVYAAHPEYHYDRDFRGYGEQGLQGLNWPNDAKIAGGERSIMSGDGESESNLVENPGRPPRVNERNANVESEYEYGSRAGFWRLFRLFDKHNMHFTLYAVAQAVEENPEVVSRCVDKGHDIASHAYRWIDYQGMSIEKETELVRKAIESLKKLAGYAPKGWYYGRGSPQSRTLVPRVYEEMGEELVWMSDTYADDVPYWTDRADEKDKPDPKGLLMVPYSYDCNDFKFHTAGSGFRDPNGFYTHMKNAFDVLYEEGEEGSPKMMTIGLHCRIVGRPGRCKALKDFVEYISQKEGVWVATRTEIANAFAEQFPYQKGELAKAKSV